MHICKVAQKMGDKFVIFYSQNMLHFSLKNGIII